MRHLFFVLILCGLLSSGCESDNLETLELESALDAKLAQSQVSGSAPSAAPGEPQKGFEQEVAEAQTL